MGNIRLAMPNMKDARMRRKANIDKIQFELEERFLNYGLNKTYHVLTYGCQGNESDSEVISGILEAMGYKKSADVFKADVIFLNTCAIRENAENRIWGVLGQMKGLKNERPDVLIGICGCMPQEEKTTEKLLKSYPFVDIIFGTHNINKIPYLINSAQQSHKQIVEVLSEEGYVLENAPRKRELTYKAWINIMYGCDEFCTYCIVPYTRGKERSRDKEDIINEVSNLVLHGYKEITLLGQNVNSYGRDKNDGYTFGNLLFDLDKTGIERIRFTTSHPKDFDDITIDAMANCKSVMPQLHLPVQSGSNEILKKMNRKYTKEEYLEKVNKLKKAVPEISITTDIIVGFPGETEEMFFETMDLVDKVGFEGAFTFVFSPREGTPAFSMVDDTDMEIKKERLYLLNEKINAGYLQGHARFLNKEVSVLVDGVSKNGVDMMCGYSPNLKLVHFKSCDNSLIGKTVRVKINEAKTWFMIGELING